MADIFTTNIDLTGTGPISRLGIEARIVDSSNQSVTLGDYEGTAKRFIFPDDIASKLDTGEKQVLRQGIVDTLIQILHTRHA